MADTIRERILAELKSTLTTALATPLPAIPVERNRDVAVSAYPTVVIVDGPQTADSENTHRTEYRMEVDVEGYVKAVTPDLLGAAVNALYSRVVRAVLANRIFNATEPAGLACDTRETEMLVEISRTEGSPPQAAFSVTFEIVFWTAEGDPESLGPT